MNTNFVDYIAWAVIIGVTIYVLNSGMKKYEAQGSLNKFYAMTLGGMMVAFFILFWMKSGYSYDKDAKQCKKGGFGYCKYESEEECLSKEKKDMITGLSFF